MRWVALSCAAATAAATTSDVTIDVTPIHDISPLLWGVFFEDINFAGDGGIYAEMIRNRDFEALGRGNVGVGAAQTAPASGYTPPEPLYADMRPWALTGEAGLDVRLTNVTQPFVTNPMVVHINAAELGGGLSNPGYWGINVVEGKAANLSVFVKSTAPSNLVFSFNGVSAASKVDAGDHAVCDESARIAASCGGCGPNWGDMAQCQELCYSHSDCTHYTYFGDGGCRMYSACDSTWDQDFGGGSVLTTIYKRGAATILASTSIAVSGDWTEYRAILIPEASDPAGSFAVRCDGACDLYLDHVSLFPSDAIAGIFRRDITASLKGISPSFVRFPGGNYLEGNDLDSRWAWKKTVGPRQARPGHYNSAWGYWVTDGLGFHEYLMLCEELEAEAQFSVYTGYSMGQPYVPMDKSGEFIQDALGAIEYANGNTATPYGKMRAEAGHGEPFNLRRYEVGNEESNMEGYKPHYEAITQAMWAKQPEATIIASGRWGPSVDGHPCTNGDRCDLWDDHYYREPDVMAGMSHQYDDYDRSLPDVFVGEYAANVGHKMNLQAALAEAMFMVGFERNADKVKQASFAPLFKNVHGTQWDYDMIAYDANQTYAIPSYWVQQMFALQRGDHTVGVQGGDGVVSDIVASVKEDGTVIVKVVSYNGPGGSIRFKLDGAKAVATVLTLSGDPLAENSFEAPTNVSPTTTMVEAASDGFFTFDVQPWSLICIRIPKADLPLVV